MTKGQHHSTGFLDGVVAIPRGAALILRTPRLLAWAVVPAVISVTLFVILAAVAFMHGDDLLKLVWSGDFEPGHWYTPILAAVHWLSELLVRLILVLLSAVAAFFASMIIVEPFIDVLSETTEKKLGVMPPDEGFSVRRIARELGFAIVDVSLDIGLFVVYQLGCLIFLGIPVIGGLVCVTAQTCGAALFAGIEMMSGPLARRGLHGRRRWRRLLERKALVAGVGAGALIVALAPLAQLFTLPIAVVGGTIAVIEAGLLRSDLSESR